jgi:hypothetical protein
MDLGASAVIGRLPAGPVVSTNHGVSVAFLVSMNHGLLPQRQKSLEGANRPRTLPRSAFVDRVTFD